LLLDGAGYFGALRCSLLKARRRICLAGWDIDSRTPIRGASAPDDGAPELLGELLEYLVENNDELVVHLLLWDFSVLYTFSREPLPRFNLDWRTPSRVAVCLDDQLPFGASHHEKLAIIDDRLAYCGGLDLTIRRWDRPEHRASEPQRCDPNRQPYGPYHDVQMLVDGETARSLSDLVRARWNRVTGDDLQALEIESDPWPDGIEPDLHETDMAITRTQPAFDGAPEVREIEAAYLDAIERARELVYIENQYLTVDRIAKALRRRLEAQRSLEVFIVSPKSPHGWLEAETMGVGRARFMRELRADDLADRVRFVYPWTADESGEVPVMVHAKLLIVDDRLLHIGSSNLNYRSMGTDRECDLHIEARSDAQASAIKQLRRRLLAHHLGTSVDELGAEEDARGSIIAIADAQASSTRGLRRIDASENAATLQTEVLADLGDPERPLDPEEFIGNLFGARRVPLMRRYLLRLIGAAALVSIVALIWHFSPLADWINGPAVNAALQTIAASRWSGPLLLAAFVAASVTLFPVTAMIALTAAALGPLQGFVWAFLGAMLAASFNFACGRLIPEATLERWVGPWVKNVGKRLSRGGIVSIMIVRNIPIAPFTIVNLVAGAARLPFRDYLLGTALGMGPGIVALTILGGRLRAALQDPTWPSLALLAAAIVLWLGIALGLQALSNRYSNAR
jgi:phosphatidylserine/phosphatidylglycerophosphate/cardiolipin synthase-like enzyme/uncharacterized membrane protein YdjX (TVP38/TMEM64 family)